MVKHCVYIAKIGSSILSRGTKIKVDTVIKDSIIQCKLRMNTADILYIMAAQDQ